MELQEAHESGVDNLIEESRRSREREGEREREGDSTWVLEGTGAFESQKSRSATWRRGGGRGEKE